MSHAIEVGVATPKGMRQTRFPVNGSDVIHVYSDDTHIWIQLRRNVSSEQNIGRSSFKVALCMQPGTANKLGEELMKVSNKNKERRKGPTLSAKPLQAKP